ncbi:hypothetical protein G7046_g2506 [Stylonectria norvegica]|nr:hypothetical protein G7046_g2506 [Stylonectria norvegica]
MGERWDRDRFMYERQRDQSRDTARMDDDRYAMRGGRGGGRDGGRDGSDDRQDRRRNPSFDDDDMVRDRRQYDDEPRFMPPRREREQEPEFRRAPVMEKERERERDFPRRGSPPARRRPAFLRRQSSLDTFDRRPQAIFHEREEYPVPVRREDLRRDDFRAPPYTPIPLPKARGLPPPGRYPDQGFYDDIKGPGSERFGGPDDFNPYPERIREREVVKSRRRRDTSRDSFSTRTRSHRSSSVASSLSSSSSSSSGGTTVRDEYPKKGKTRIPEKLVSQKALIDLGYPYVQEGNTIIVQKALGQDNIDELLKLSEDYKKLDADRARPPPAALMPPPPTESRAPAPPAPETRAPDPAPSPPTSAPAPTPVYQPPPPAAPEQRAPPPPQQQQQQGPPPPPFATKPPPTPVIIDARPEPPIEFYEEDEYYREVSPARSTTTTSSWDTRSHHRRRHRREKSAPIAVGPMALVERSRSRSKSRGGRELRAEIRALERELAHRPRGGPPEREIVRAERLPDGQLVIYEEQVENVVEHHKPPRIEKDKKGRMSISVPKPKR